jgi:hypothetical protein
MDETYADPPDQGMKPESRFDDHVQARNEIVVAAHVR